MRMLLEKWSAIVNGMRVDRCALSSSSRSSSGGDDPLLTCRCFHGTHKENHETVILFSSSLAAVDGSNRISLRRLGM